MTGMLTCILPAYQAGATIAAVVAGLRASLPEAIILAVDDGSTDDTAWAAGACCDAVIAFPINRGKGAALRAGAEHALLSGAHAILTLDADGQHDPAAAPALVRALDHADLAIGVRARSRSRMPLTRRFTNAASSLAMSACARTRLRDPQSGYRAYRRAVLEGVRPAGDRYEYETDLLLRALRAGFRLAQVEVPTLYGPPSHFLPLHDTRRVVRAIWGHRTGVLGAANRARGVGRSVSVPPPTGRGS